MRNYYLTKSGVLKRKQNTLFFETEKEKIPIPIKDIYSLYILGEISLNSKALHFLAQNKVPMHFFNYYGFYTGSFFPRDYLPSGFLIINQVKHYLDTAKRLTIAREIVSSASHNILKNLQTYKKRGKPVSQMIYRIKQLRKQIHSAESPTALMGIEGNIRESYYSSFPMILKGVPAFKRVVRPPDNIINCLLSFGNSLLYATTLTEIYHTQLNPTISYLHEPGTRRFSLSLDLSEIFKPVIVDRLLFDLINNRKIKETHFIKELNFCFLNARGKRKVLQEYDQRLNHTVLHPKLKRKISFRWVIRIECYKLIKHLIGEKKYSGFKVR